MARRNQRVDGRIRQAFEAAQNVGPGQQLSTGQQLREATLYIDPSDSEAVRRFYDHMPEAVKEYGKWKREAARLVTETSEAGSFLTMAFTGNYTHEEVYDEFTSKSFTNEMERLRSDIVHNKVIDGMKLAQDAARDFAWWQQFHGDVSSTSAALTSMVGVTSIFAGAAFGLPALVAAGPAAVPVVAFQLWFGWNRGARNKEGRLNLRDVAIIVSNITDSIERDVHFLDEIGGCIADVARRQQNVRSKGHINNLQNDIIISSAREMAEASNRYIQTDVARC